MQSGVNSSTVVCRLSNLKLYLTCSFSVLVCVTLFAFRFTGLNSAWFTCSSVIPRQTPPLLIVLARHSRKPLSLFSCWTKSLTSETIMSDKKRKMPSAAGGPVAKQQKLIPMKQQEKKEKPSGWLPDLLKQKREENKEMKFNKKRLRFISDTQKMKQGSDGVLYWMSRDQRVQGKLQEKIAGEDYLDCIFSSVTCFLCFPSVF